MRHRDTPSAGWLCLAFLLCLSWSPLARGDGGTLRHWRRDGGYDIAVFTDPTPIVVGPVDFSVLLLDADSGEPIEGAKVMIEVTPQGRAERTLRLAATMEAATNKLLRATLVELQSSGRHSVRVTVKGPRGDAQVAFGVDVAPATTAFAGLWPWILGPFPVIALYAIHQHLVQRQPRRAGFNLPSSGQVPERQVETCPTDL